MAETSGSSDGNSPSANAPKTEFGRSIGRDIETDHDKALSLRDKVDQDITLVKESAQDVAHKAADKVSEVAERQKGYAADQISKVATALERVGDQLTSEDSGAIGGYATQLGASARQFAEKVKDKNLSEIAGLAEDFGRRQPLAFLGLAAVAGLAASRFLMASKSSNPSSMANTSPTNDRRETYNG